MEDHCFWAARAILAHEPFEALRRADDPRVRRVQAYYDRWAAGLIASGRLADSRRRVGRQ